MKVPMADLQAQYRALKDEIDGAVGAVMSGCHFILGENEKELEGEIALLCGATYGVGVASGTDALILALSALGVGPGDEVITTPFTFVATTEAIVLLGATPVYADIDPATFNLDPDKIEEKITDKTKAILPVHLFGQAADVGRIPEIAAKHDLRIVWDGAQAIGALAHDRGIGAFGNVVTLSFFPTKNLGGAGDGGMILTSDKEIHERLKYIRFHGSGGGYSYKYVGYCSRLDEIQAAVLRAKLPHLDKWNDGRRKNADIYKNTLAGLPLTLPVEKPENRHIYHQFTITCEKRDELKAYLMEREVGCGVYYPSPLHLEEAYRYLGYKEGDLPAAEKICREVISLPVVPELSEEQVQFAADMVKSFFQK